jgi:pilus assembly protein FimV
MKLMNQYIKKLFLLCLLLFPLTGFTLQLGKIVVTSSQGQPLNAEIEMMLTPGEDMSKLQTSIASKENYEAQGIERLAIHNNISVELQKNEKGLTVLKLKSTQPVPDPFLDLLIQVDSGKGRNYREYTVLLDPPETPIIQQEKIIAVDKTNSAPIIEKKEIREIAEKTKVMPEKEIKNNSKPVDKSKSLDATSKSITIKPADTIYKIARENKIADITTEQMVVGIFNLNELAFTAKNINGLEVGQKIILPTKDDFINLSHAKAMAEIKIQMAQWNKFSVKTAESVADSPMVNTPKSETPPVPVTIVQNQSTAPLPRIKLTGDTLTIDKNSKEVAQKEINQINDDKTALEKNIKDAELKILLLEKELVDAKKILALSNQALFELQEKSKQVNQTKDAANKPPVIESKPDLNSLINKPNESDISKNDLPAPADTSFKSSISDGPNDEKTNAQLASDKEPTSSSSFNELFIYLGVLFAILIMLFVIKSKKQNEKKELIQSINIEPVTKTKKQEDMKPSIESIDINLLKHPKITINTEALTPKKKDSLEDIDLSGIEINLSNKDQN